MQRALRVLTYNIWFDTRDLLERMAHIKTLLASSGADIVCLQEVTPASYKLLLQDCDTLTSQYDVSPLHRRCVECGYFALMLTKKGLRAKFSVCRVPSEMGRHLVVARFPLLAVEDERVLTTECSSGRSHVVVPDGARLDVTQRDEAAANVDDVHHCAVATAHFESLSSRPLRAQQLKIAYDVVSQHKFWVICGDFNFCSYQNFGGRQPNNLENTILSATMPDHVDCWAHLHPEASTLPTEDIRRGYTFDSTRNSNIHKYEQMRYDRVLCSAKSLHPLRMSLFGTDAVPGNHAQHRRSMRPLRSGSSRSPVRPACVPPGPQEGGQTSGSAGLESKRVPPLSIEACYQSSPNALLHPSDHFGLMCDLGVVPEFVPAQH